MLSAGSADATAVNGLDYVRRVNALSEGLLRSHAHLLARKAIHSKRQLIQAIKLDLDKIAHALVEVKENSAEAVLERFFYDAGFNRAAAAERLASRRIFHIGFEINEPLALV